jgi:hypothetical protein
MIKAWIGKYLMVVLNHYDLEIPYCIMRRILVEV